MTDEAAIAEMAYQLGMKNNLKKTRRMNAGERLEYILDRICSGGYVVVWWWWWWWWW